MQDRSTDYFRLGFMTYKKRFLYLLTLWNLLGFARQQSFRHSKSFCAVHPDTMKILVSFLFFPLETLDRDHSFGKNGLDQGYFLDTHIVSARIERTWTTSIQTAQDISKHSEGNLQSDITRYYHLQRTLTWAQAKGRCWSLRWKHKREDGVG